VPRRIDLLASQMEETYGELHARLVGLTDEEFFWEPARDCWTVHRGPDGRWTYHTIVTPGTSAATIEVLERGQQLLQADLDAAAEEDLDRPVPTNWGEMWPVWRIFWTMIEHDARHGAEIGALRDLYRAIGGGGLRNAHG